MGSPITFTLWFKGLWYWSCWHWIIIIICWSCWPYEKWQMLGLFTKWGWFTARGVAVLPLRNPAVQLRFLQVWFSSVKISSTELFYWSKISWEYSPEYNPGSWSKTDFQIHAIILTLIDLGTVGLDMSCLKSRTKSGHLLFWMIMLIIMLAAETYLAFGLRKRQLMSHMKGPSRGLIATCV